MSTSRLGIVAAGGAAVFVGQAALSQFDGFAGEVPTVSVTSAGFEEPARPPTVLAAVAPPSGPRHIGFSPVVLAPEPEQVDADSLAKSARLAEAALNAQRKAQQAESEAAARVADQPFVRGAKCPANRAGFGPVKSWVGGAGTALRCIFDVRDVGGVAGRAGVSDHPAGLALDFMTTKGVNGDQLAEYALRYQNQLKITYVIWKQRINFGSGWKGMEDRGSITANHFDHVHISFDAR